MEATKSFNAPEAKLHFLDYWRIVRIRKTVILAVFLLVAITTTLVTFILPESFASTVRIKVEKDGSDVAGLGQEGFGGGGFDPYWIQDQFETIQSKMILYQVITNLNLNKKWAEKYKEEGEFHTDQTYALLKNRVDVRQSRGTSLIEIRALSEDKSEAAVIANEVAEVYKNSRLNLRREQSQHGIETLRHQLDEQDKKVAAKQELVNKMREQFNIPDTESPAWYGDNTPDSENLRHTDRLRIEAQAQYAEMRTMYDQLKGYSRSELRKAVQVVAPDQQLATLMTDFNMSQQKLADMEGAYAAEHPEVKRIKGVIAQIDVQINDRLDGVLAGLSARVAAAKAKLDQFVLEANSAKTNQVNTMNVRRPYYMAKRELENTLLVREKLSMRIIQEEVEVALPKQRIVQIIDRAEPAIRPVKPNKTLNIALGIVVGLAIGVGLAFFIEYLDTSVKTIDDVERALQAPVMGVIPQNVGHLLEEGPDSPHAEAYRVLRTNILFSQKDPSMNTLTIVSAGAGEGKSTTSFNLATIFAQNGQRVVIVDSDLRRPSLHKILKVSNSIGLTNYLLKQNSLEEVIQTTPLATLDFLPSGRLPSSSMGVLSSAQMKELIRELKRRYDWVFFDSPPIMGVSDASILASEVDMVLQVIQYRRYPQPMTIRAKQMIEKVGGNLLGIVLNNINMASDENYYYYSGYYYDYYSKQEDEPEGAKPAGSSKAGKDEVEIKTKY
jgi:succinoglycan biosynthesis transport protein ExoP